MESSQESRSIFRITNVDHYDLISVLYLWFLSFLLVSITTIPVEKISSAGTILVATSILYTFFSLLTYNFSGSKVWAPALSFICYLILATAPLLNSELSGKGSAILLTLHYTVLVAIPAFFTLWSWKLQMLAAMAALVGMWFSLADSFSNELFKFVILTGSACLLSVRLVYFRNSRGRAGVLRVPSVEDPEEASLDGSFKPKLWNVSLFQGGLIVALLMLSGEFQSSNFLSNQSFTFKIYALLVLLIGNLITGFSQKVSSQLIALLTLATVTFLLVLSMNLGQIQTGTQLLLPVLFMGFSTLALGWSFPYQVWFIWAVSLFTVLSMSLAEARFTFGGGFGLNLASFDKELSLLLIGLSLSVWFSKKLEIRFRNSTVKVPSAVSHMTVESKELSTFVSFKAIRSKLAEHRLGLMLKSLLFLAILSGFISTSLLIGAGSSLMGLALLTLVCSAMGWMAVNYVAGVRDEESREYIWLAGAILSALLIIWPAILIINSFKVSQLSHVWILLPFVTIGLVPWRWSELLPLMAISIFCGLEILESSQITQDLWLYYLSVGLLAILCNVYRTRRLIERDVLETFPISLSTCATVREVILATIDAHLAYFQGSQAMLQSREGEIDLVKNNSISRIKSNDISLYDLPISRPDKDYKISEVSLSICNWNTQVEFFHPEFGLVQEFHGLHFEYPSPSNFVGAAPGALVSGRGSVIFLPFRLPFVKFLREDDIRLSEQIFQLARMRIDSCIEKENSLRIAEANQLLNKRREFELNALVHDINNTVQDLTVSCDSLTDRLENEESTIHKDSLVDELSKISDVARSMASSVSDAKRKRELEGLKDLRPRELVEVKECLDDVVSLSTVRATRKGISLVYQELERPVWIKLSAHEHFSTIMRNLINNAIQYSDSGSEVKISASIFGECLKIQVVDNGPGLSEGEIESIFSAGVRGASGKNVSGGLGVGLAQSRRVAEAGGGSLTVSSEGPGLGSDFTLSLPECPAPCNNDKIWALLVDDQKSVVDFYSKIARALEFEPEVACSVDEAERLIKEFGQPGFVLTDLHLGKSSGFSVIEKVRNMFGDHVPIMVVSGLPDDDIEQRVKKAGANDFLSKPVGRKALLSRMESLLSQVRFMNGFKN